MKMIYKDAKMGPESSSSRITYIRQESSGSRWYCSGEVNYYICICNQVQALALAEVPDDIYEVVCAFDETLLSRQAQGGSVLIGRLTQLVQVHSWSIKKMNVPLPKTCIGICCHVHSDKRNHGVNAQQMSQEYAVYQATLGATAYCPWVTLSRKTIL